MLPNVWSTDGELTVSEQKQVENNEELASSYERKLIEVKYAAQLLKDSDDNVAFEAVNISLAFFPH